jgi:hypothetical protein
VTMSAAELVKLKCNFQNEQRKLLTNSNSIINSNDGFPNNISEPSSRSASLPMSVRKEGEGRTRSHSQNSL